MPFTTFMHNYLQCLGLLFKCLEMPKPLSKEVEENILSILHRGCSQREIARSLHVSVGAVHSLCQLHLPNANCSCGGRPRIMSRVEERTCVLEMVRGRVGTCANAARHMNQALGIQVSRQTVMCTLVRVGLLSQKKVKKPHLSTKNVKVRLEFARIRQHWIVKIRVELYFQMRVKSIVFAQIELLGVGHET